MTELIDKVFARFEAKFVGVNALGIDRLHKGTEAEVKFYVQLILQYRAMESAMDTAAFSMQVMAAKIVDFEEAQKEAGELSMGLGDES